MYVGPWQEYQWAKDRLKRSDDVSDKILNVLQEMDDSESKKQLCEFLSPLLNNTSQRILSSLSAPTSQRYSEKFHESASLRDATLIQSYSAQLPIFRRPVSGT